MIIYAPYLALAFWGTMLFFAAGDIIKKGKAPFIIKITDKIGMAVFIITAVLVIGAFSLAYIDSEIIRRHESPVGIFTFIAFIPLIISDVLLAAKIFNPNNKKKT